MVKKDYKLIAPVVRLIQEIEKLDPQEDILNDLRGLLRKLNRGDDIKTDHYNNVTREANYLLEAKETMESFKANVIKAAELEKQGLFPCTPVEKEVRKIMNEKDSEEECKPRFEDYTEVKKRENANINKINIFNSLLQDIEDKKENKAEEKFKLLEKIVNEEFKVMSNPPSEKEIKDADEIVRKNKLVTKAEKYLKEVFNKVEDKLDLDVEDDEISPAIKSTAEHINQLVNKKQIDPLSDFPELIAEGLNPIAVSYWKQTYGKCKDDAPTIKIKERSTSDILGSAFDTIKKYSSIFDDKEVNSFLGDLSKDIDPNVANVIEQAHKQIHSTPTVIDFNCKYNTLTEILQLVEKLEDLVAEYTEKQILTEDKFYTASDNKKNIKTAKKESLKASRKLSMAQKALDEVMDLLNMVRISELPKSFFENKEDLNKVFTAPDIKYYRQITDEEKRDKSLFDYHNAEHKAKIEQLKNTGAVGKIKRTKPKTK